MGTVLSGREQTEIEWEGESYYDRKVKKLRKRNRERWEDELQQHTHCTVEEPCSLAATLEWLDEISRVPLDSPLMIKAKAAARGLIDAISCAMKNIDPKYECTVHNKGSAYNGTKVGRADEFDFLLELVRFQFKEWDVKAVKRQRKHSQYLNVASTRTVNGIDEACQGFQTVFSQVLESMQESAEARTKYSFSRLEEYKTTLLLRVEGLAFLVSVDVTPCVRVGSKLYTYKEIPGVAVLANEDPCEILDSQARQKNDSLMKTIRLFKTVANIYTCERGLFTKAVSQPCLAICKLRQRNYFAVAVRTTKRLSDYFTMRHPGCTSRIPSWAILGSVLRVYREHPDYPICRLLVTAIATFDNVDPHGMLLFCTLDGYFQSPLLYCTNILETFATLKTISEKNKLLDIVPSWYSDTCAFDVDSSQLSNVCLESFSLPLSEVPMLPCPSSEGNHATVYRVRTSQLFSVLSLSARQDSEFTADLHSELEDLEAVADEVYLAVVEHPRCDLGWYRCNYGGVFKRYDLEGSSVADVMEKFQKSDAFCLNHFSAIVSSDDLK